MESQVIETKESVHHPGPNQESLNQYLSKLDLSKTVSTNIRQKAAEKYVDVTFKFDTNNFPYKEWNPWIPIEYRRTGQDWVW